MNALDQGDLVPRASVEASRRAHEHFITTSSGSQTYSRITASGSSRIHNGNNYYITYDYSTGHGPVPTLPSDRQTTLEHVSRSSQKRKRSVSDAPGMPCENRERQTLATVLESLGQYSTSIQQQSKGEQSTMIAARLAIILEHFEHAALQPFEEAASEQTTVPHLDRQLQDLKHQLHRATSIKINAISPRAQASRQYKAQSELTRIAWGRWEISLCTKTLHSRSVDGQMLTETCSALNVQNAVGSRGPCISAYFGESVDVDRTITMHPIVLAYNQVDNDAKVFELVKNDDLDGLMRHLALGEASIRDCDEAGRPLLHYACEHASVKTCKFLVDSGCDLDRIAIAFYWDKIKTTPLSSVENFYPNSSGRSMKCRQHLLKAGADPTLGTMDTRSDSLSKSTVIEMLYESLGGCRTTEHFEQVLREGSAFFDVRSFRQQGQSIWMHACSNVVSLSSLKILEVLVRAGAMTAEVDDDGWNCLFKCAGHSRVPWLSNEYEALRFLLTVFEDIFARDSKGRSIFDVVADREMAPDNYCGSYRQDLWYCALFRSGLAQRFNIPLRPGRLIFDKLYCLTDYQALLYLDTWGSNEVEQRISDDLFVNEDATSEQDRETAPGLREWNTSDLVAMEKRTGWAIDLCEDGDDHFYGLSTEDYASFELSDGWEMELEEECTR